MIQRMNIQYFDIRSLRKVGHIFVILMALGVTATAKAQQVTIATPLQTGRDSFYSNFGTRWSFSHQSANGAMFFRHGGFGPPTAFGGLDPDSQSLFGVGGRKGDTSWDFSVIGGQGSDYSSATTTPILTVPNNGFGFINDTIRRPFVTGVIPVVGGRPMANPQLAHLRAERERSKQIVRAQFAKAASAYRQQRDAERQRKLKELEALKSKNRSNLATRNKSSREVDPPLVLRGVNGPSSDQAAERDSKN